MSLRTNKIALSLRNVGRELGVNKFIMKLAGSKSYEDKFNKFLLGSVHPNDCVWDVGANIGFYTTQFAELVGATGKVFAFEPSPQNYSELQKNVSAAGNVNLLPFGLGEKAETLAFKQGDDDLGATSQVLTPGQEQGGTTFQVEIRSGDQLVQSGVAQTPNSIKIDVEGFELEVLNGMKQILRNQALRSIAIEVHFGLLANRGMANAPKEIELMLSAAGFSCSWPDPSHLVGVRSK